MMEGWHDWSAIGVYESRHSSFITGGPGPRSMGYSRGSGASPTDDDGAVKGRPDS